MKSTVNAYIDRCISAAIALKPQFPEQTTREFWLPFAEVFPGRQRITRKLTDEVITACKRRNITCNPITEPDGMSFNIDLTKVILTAEQAQAVYC